MFICIFALLLLLLLVGLYGFFVAKDGIVKELAFGTLMMGIGYIGLLKSAIEIFENHRMEEAPTDCRI